MKTFHVDTTGLTVGVLLFVGAGCATTSPDSAFEALMAQSQATQRARVAALGPTERALVVKLATLRHPTYPGNPVTDLEAQAALQRDANACIEGTEAHFKATGTGMYSTADAVREKFYATVFDCLDTGGWSPAVNIETRKPDQRAPAAAGRVRLSI